MGGLKVYSKTNTIKIEVDGIYGDKHLLAFIFPDEWNDAEITSFMVRCSKECKKWSDEHK